MHVQASLYIYVYIYIHIYMYIYTHTYVDKCVYLTLLKVHFPINSCRYGAF